MKRFDLMKVAALGAALICTSLVDARYWQLRGAWQDASQNIYTASPYPASTKLRVSKRNATNSSFWVKDFNPPAGFRYSSLQCVRSDASGNVYVATVIDNSTTSVSQFQLLKISSAGALLNSTTYNPAAAGQQIFLGGLTLDSSGNVYLAGAYNVSGSLNGSFVVKYNSSLGSGVARAITLPGGGNYLYADDIVADGSGNVYVSAWGYPPSGLDTIAVVSKFDATFGASPVWQGIYHGPANTGSANEGCLAIDGSNRLTYVGAYNDFNNGGRTAFYAVQFNSSGAQTWASTPGLLDSQSTWTTVDSSGNVVVVGSSVGTGYQIAKLNGSTGALTWNQTFVLSGASPRTVCQDASGDFLVVRPETSGSNTYSKVDRFVGSTGAFSTTYASTGPNDYGYSVFPSSTAGTFFVAGVGLSGSYVPLVYRSGTGAWKVYQTATT